VFTAESRERIDEFRNVILQANLREARRALNINEPAEKCGMALHRKTGCPVLLTVGANGIFVFDETGDDHVPAVPVGGSIDTVGAGDSVLAGFTAARCAGASLSESAEIGNLVASITIQQIGTTGTATPHQVLDTFRQSQQF
jgi:sugar/nucleoside kinase (ribokinase family)